MKKPRGARRLCSGCGCDMRGFEDHRTKYCVRCEKPGRTAIEDNRGGAERDLPDEEPPPRRHDLRKIHGFRGKR